MPRPAESCPGSDDPGFGLRSLAALINEVWAGLGTRSVLALDGPGNPFAMQMAVDVAAVPPKAVRGAHAATQQSRPPTTPVDDNSTPIVDELHIETWRLVGLAQDGDGEAFGQLYDRYVDTVYRFIYYRVNDRALAEDFTSETFLRALRRISTISYQGRDIGAWFVTIARNIVLDHMKSARHRLEITTADTIEGNDREPSPEDAVLESLASARLMAAVKQLGDEQRECVMLRFIQGFSVSETATVMGKNDGAIKALQHRAVRKLADLVGTDLR
jgi:RNA polymerase sigma-70 factor (ECF subfamily)